MGHAAVGRQSRQVGDVPCSAGTQLQEGLEREQVRDLQDPPHVALDVRAHVIREPPRRVELSIVDARIGAPGTGRGGAERSARRRVPPAPELIEELLQGRAGEVEGIAVPEVHARVLRGSGLAKGDLPDCPGPECVITGCWPATLRGNGAESRSIIEIKAACRLGYIKIGS